MSAIAGIYFLDDRSVDRPDLERMLEHVAHRGTDGAGVWIEGAVGLGHRMLWTTPESLHEKLPLTSKTGNLVLTADARIDNRDELIAALDPNDRPQDEITDSELILAAYEQWGESCAEKLLGDFAFVIWDGRRQILFCARDHFGVKPFYYHYRDGRVFVFASEIKALLCLSEVPRRLNEVKLADYLIPTLQDKEITFYQDILRLTPAHTMTVSREGVALRPYWALDPSCELRLGSDEEYAEAFLKLFTEAVRCRLRSAYPIGSMLSGGLDSSSIVCVARQLLSQNGNGRLHTFSAIFDDLPDCDERLYIKAVVAQGRLETHYVHGDTIGPLTDLNRVLHYEDEPFWTPNLYLHWALYSAAHEQGVRILLDGIDGDTTLWQRPEYLAELLRGGEWKTLATEVTEISRRFNRSPWRIMLRHAIIPMVPYALRMAWLSLRGRNQVLLNVNSIINPEFSRRMGLEERLGALQVDWLSPARTSREDHWRHLTWGLIPFVLEVADRAAASFSIEPHYPFFDKRLVEFCLALPREQKLCQGWSRIVMRRALANILPAKVQWRSGKSTLSPAFTRGLQGFDGRSLEDVVLKDRKVLEQYVDLGAFCKVHERYVSLGKNDDALRVWWTATLALWLNRTHLSC